MTIIACVYISLPQNISSGLEFAKKLFDYSIQSCLLTSIKNKEVSVFPYEAVESLQAVTPMLIKNHYMIVIADTMISLDCRELLVISVDFPTQTIYTNGQKFNGNDTKDFERFLVSLIKSKGSTASGITYNDVPYVFTSGDDTMNFALSKERVNPCMNNLKPKIFMEWNFGSSTDLVNLWKRHTKYIELTDKKEEATHHVTINCAATVNPKDKVIYFCMEPYGEREHMYKRYIDNIPGCIFLGTHEHHLNNVEWHLDKTYTELQNLKITKKFDKALSVIVSYKNSDPGHKYRLELIRRLDDMPNLPFTLDIYGKCKDLNFKHYRGELPKFKDAGLFPYKYHINVENNYINNYITEKLYDSFLTDTLCFYKGPENVSTFFNPQGYVELSGYPEKIAEDVKLIVDTVMNDGWEQRIHAIRENKQRILKQYAFEPRMLGIIQMIRTQCFAGSQEVVNHLYDVGFKLSNVTPSPLKLEEVFSKGLTAHYAAVYIQATDTKYPNLFDKLCFAFADNPNADAYLIKDYPLIDAKDVCYMPSGQEKVLTNLKNGRNMLEGLKICNVAL